MKKKKYMEPLVEIITLTSNSDILTSSTIIQQDGGLGISFDGSLWGGVLK